MAWVRIDENFAQHPKVVRAGPLGMAMHVAALCYCNRHLTDGFVPKQIAKGLLDLDGLAMRPSTGEANSKQVASTLLGENAKSRQQPDSNRSSVNYEVQWYIIIDALVDAGLWIPIEGGWKIHDYLDYQPSRASTQSLRAKRREAGSRGGRSKTTTNSEANPEQLAKQNGSKLPSKRTSKTEAKTKPVPVPVPLDSESESSMKTRASTETPDGVAQDDLDTVLFRRGKALLGKNAGGQINKLKRILGTGRALEALETAGRKENPAEYIAAVIHRAGADPPDERPLGLGF